MSPGGDREGRSVDELFAEVAAAVDGTVHGGFGFGPRVQKAAGDWILTLDRVRTESGRMHTRLRAPYRTAEPFGFEMRDVRRVDDLLETLGFLQDVTIGDVELDRRFVIKGTSWGKIRAVFLDGRVREILRAQPSVHLKTSPFPRFGPPFVENLWELHFREPGEIADVSRLADLFELFERLLPRLCPEGRGWEGDLGRLVQRLLGPGAAFTDIPGPVVVWDGGRVRRDAAERLGRLGNPEAVGPLLSVLDDPDDGLVAGAAMALARLGAEEAVGPLVRMLGERKRETGSGALCEVAARALEGLGRADLPAALESALDGDPSALMRTDHRDDVVSALLTILDSSDFMAAADAARALGALGARQAIPLLRSRSRGWGMRTTLTEACQAALEEIEARSGLPRPARPEPGDRETLPRPAAPSGNPGETLPRPVDGEDEAP